MLPLDPLSDPRPTEELFALLSALEMDDDKDEYWNLVRIVQHRLPDVFPLVQAMAQSGEVKVMGPAATVFGQNFIEKKVLQKECDCELRHLLNPTQHPFVICRPFPPLAS